MPAMPPSLHTIKGKPKERKPSITRAESDRRKYETPLARPKASNPRTKMVANFLIASDDT
jgi:hypothetical protein